MIEVPELKCLKCGYKWYPRTAPKLPKQCPNCKRMDWNKRKVK